MKQIVIFIVLCFLFVLSFENNSNSKIRAHWFPCCEYSAWEQLTKNMSYQLKLTTTQKMHLATLAKEMEPSIQLIIRQKIIKRLQLLQDINKALTDNNITKIEKAIIQQDINELTSGRMKIISILLQGKILVDNILTEKQLNQLKTTDFLIDLPSAIKLSLLHIQQIIDYILKHSKTAIEEEKINELQYAFNNLVRNVCLPEEIKKVLLFQFDIIADNIEFFLNKKKVIDVIGIDVSLQNMKIVLDEIIKKSNKGKVDSIWLLERISKALGLPAIELIAKFGVMIRPLVAEAFLISPVILSCEL